MLFPKVESEVDALTFRVDSCLFGTSPLALELLVFEFEPAVKLSGLEESVLKATEADECQQHNVIIKISCLSSHLFPIVDC